MTRIVLTAAAIFVATGSAFAGSDHYGSDNANQPVANVDNAFTASVRKPDTAQPSGVDTMITTGFGQGVLDTIARHNNDGIWGR
ncbi:DUF680 domain-containing protein [Mesorhizobium sp.]|uniref:DUF680 domain-containing protein n=1 Tax=Mesorhizobium sp. TaxID=1871066 RepID=UPI001219A1DB|nr:DUF680 domain-containing protein [Mesorhizobium sp.]TIS87868.1 MAG: DUF680 domain-containing protein [Mesorhizobium sp.]